LASPNALKLFIIPTLDFLSTARPTAVNLSAAVRRLKRRFDTSASSGKDAREIAKDLIEESKQVYEEDVGRNKAMSKWGAEYLIKLYDPKDRLSVLTVCNTGSLATSVSHVNETTGYYRRKWTDIYRDMGPLWA
jgi:methylthioribose-1-phosphate isomerase